MDEVDREAAPPHKLIWPETYQRYRFAYKISSLSFHGLHVTKQKQAPRVWYGGQKLPVSPHWRFPDTNLTSGIFFEFALFTQHLLILSKKVQKSAPFVSAQNLAHSSWFFTILFLMFSPL